MKNEIQKYNAFSAQRVYETLAEGLEGLSDEEQVIVISGGVTQIRKRLEEIVERFKARAVNSQEKIVLKRDEEVNKKYSELEKARENRDLDKYDSVSSELIGKLTYAKQGVEGLRLLRSGKFEEYAGKQKFLDGESK
ncbi:hypothetical protein HY837_00545 [archaeon]|nr:hypothetical protein [archaeon]